MPVLRSRRKLDEIVGDLLAPLLHAKPAPGGFRLLGWDVEQGISLTIARGDDPILIELEDRDDARECYARTRRFNVCARPRLTPDRGLDPLERRAVDQLVSLVRAREANLPVIAPDPPAHGAEVREILVDRMLIAEAPGHYYLNPYAGCLIGCAFCYVAGRAALSRRIEGRAELPWGRYTDVKINAAEVLRREIAELPAGFVRMSPILTDPYQPLERRYRITRQCLEILVGTDFIPAVLTRAARVSEDADLLSRFRRAAVGISVPTDDDAIRRIFEPGGDPIDDRFAALAACRRAGVLTIAVVQPMLPMNPDRLADLLAESAEAVRIDRMYDGERVRHLYGEAGRLDAMEDGFFAETESRLRAALGARGVPVNPLDDLASLLG